MLLAPASRGGDILRGGATVDRNRKNADARNRAGAETADIAKTAARDRLARTTEAINAVRRMQQGAPAPAVAVPDGLTAGGLNRATGALARWDGALDPVQNGSTVGIKQTKSQAILHWKTFNVGRNTTVQFDQSEGKADAGKWIAFNKVFDPTGVPSQILGSIKAEGQVYILNQNGIIFGAGSQVNTRTLVASSLPVNDNLIESGLLNNRDAQFLFSALEVPGGSDGTPVFTPPTPLTPNGRIGDVVVEAGAQIQSPTSADGNGGRVMLIGANVRNDGIISTPSGQTILAAGLQVGVRAHSQDDPSLRGLDVWVGDVGTYAGVATNAGLIEALTGSILVAGREINQLGVLDSSTSVTLNGRIDLLASYGAVGNPNFDRTAGSTIPPFVSQLTGAVRLGEGSVIRILPDYLSTKAIPGTSLPESSQINIEGLAIHFAPRSTLLAPNANVTMRAGTWLYKDADGNRTTLDPTGNDEGGLAINLQGGQQRFLYEGGQVHFDYDSLIDVSGSTEAVVPLSDYLVTVQLRGTELADSPLQRTGNLRGDSLVVDLRRTGSYNGREWVGTPLGDLTGLAGIVERNAAQLTAKGGTVTIAAGDSILAQTDSTIDVSGGYFRHEGGRIVTTRLLRGRQIIDIADATPDVLYDGMYEGKNTETSAKWGITRSFSHALAPLGGYTEQGYVEGAGGGTISLTAPTLLLGGKLVGRTVKGPRQLDSPPEHGSLKIAFRGENIVGLSETDISIIEESPYAPEVRFVNGRSSIDVPAFRLAGGKPTPVNGHAAGRFLAGTSLFDENDSGFGHLSIDNKDGNVVVPEGTPVKIPAGGSLTVQAANISIEDDIIAPGGSVDLTAYNFSPFLYAKLKAIGALENLPAPAPVEGRGLITVGKNATISVAGLMIDERPGSPRAWAEARSLNGGSIAMEAYSIRLEEGSLLDASGGVLVDTFGEFAYGTGGDISLLAGQDPELDTTIGGELLMAGSVRSYSATEGGSLTIQANRIQIGGDGEITDGLLLQPEFFRQGGFTNYSLIGIGGRDANGAFLPAVRVAAGTIIEPVSETLVVSPYGSTGQLSTRPILKPVGSRPATSLSLSGIGADDPFVSPLDGVDVIEALGLVVLEERSAIFTDPGASVSIQGEAVAVHGTIVAPGGRIEIAGASSFRLPSSLSSAVTLALPTVFISGNARLSAAGTTVFLPDDFGRRSGIVHPGGTISVSGNILAEAGAVLDVSGASAVLDFHPTRLGSTSLPLVPSTAGLNSQPWGRRSVPVQVDSDAGLIELRGSQMLYSDATLLAKAGGPTALGGKLSVSSGRFYSAGEVRTSADINFVVEQTGQARQFGDVTAFGSIVDILTGRTDPTLLTTTNPGLGYFAIQHFEEGGFDSLDLAFDFNPSPSLPVGGNIEFRGPIDINARGVVRVAGGGVIRALSPVNISASYVAIGREFREPLHPDDNPLLFRRFDGTVSQDYFPTPEYGTGQLSVSADLIDIGTLLLEDVGSAIFTADGGDIRGNGTLSLAGDLVLKAAQIYPTTLATFNVFAYDHSAGPGSVTILSAGTRPAPLSAGGSINIFASKISQRGVLRAPFGSITLGWDGTDFDRSTAAFDQPVDSTVGASLTVPTTREVTLSSQSVTSVSGIDPSTGAALLIPYGLSADGLSWIDPRGVNVTVAGLPQKRVSIAGDSVVTEAGSSIDLRGGGDFFAYRWVAGTGGSADILGTPSSGWVATDSYEAGDLVSYEGKTWSARSAIDPSDFASPPEPGEGRYWSEVAESYAIVPGFSAEFAPFNSFNAGPNSSALGGDPGFVSSSLRLGQQIYLEASPGLAAGSYTLLPRRYALLPGAFLVTPQTTDPMGTATRAEGSSYVPGYTFNSVHTPRQVATLRSNYEVLPPDVLAGRVTYDIYSANTFMREAASRLDVVEVQQLPTDSGSLSFHGNSALNLHGSVLAKSISGGRGASVDISSFSDIFVVGGSGVAPPGATAVLDAGLLNSWGAESLLIGGLRRETPTGTVVDVRTSNLTLDNPGMTFFAPEIILASRAKLTLTPRSSVASSGGMTMRADQLVVGGDGTLLRVSGDIRAPISRSGLGGATNPLMIIGAEAQISGRSVLLDSTYGTKLDPTAVLTAQALTLGSGQISIVFGDASGLLTGSVVNPHLVLSGNLLTQAQATQYLTLQSYRTIDIYGTGTFGSETLGSLKLLAGGLRGYEQSGGSALFQVGEVLFNNPGNVNISALPAPPLSGELKFETNTVRLGSNAFSVAGYQNLVLDAAGGILAEGTGSFATAGDMTMITSLITGAQGVQHGITAAGALNLLGGTGQAIVTGGLGSALTFTGATLTAAADISLPSGSLALRATGGDLTVGGRLSVEGSARNFYDLVRYADAGQILLTADAGDVTFLAESEVSVAADPSGGNAGTIVVRTPLGVFNALGSIAGQGGTGGTGGSFDLDAGSIASFSNLTDLLNSSGLTESRTLRVRTGDITVSGITTVKNFSLATDNGSILVNGTIDASGVTGGKISLMARNNVTVAAGAQLTVAAEQFSSAGKGGEIHLEAGAQQNGNVNLAGFLDLQTGSRIDLSVAEFVAGSYTTPGTSAFRGQFSGVLHLRAPRTAANNDLAINPIMASIAGASSIVAEGYQLVDLTASGGLITGWRTASGTLPTAGTVQRNVYNSALAFLSAANHAAMVTRLLGADSQNLLPSLVIAPGTEIINRNGDLRLGLSNTEILTFLGAPSNVQVTSLGTALINSADWNLSDFRFGPKQAPGILTLRASGDLIFNNALSDGFANQTLANAVSRETNANSSLWLGQLRDIDPLLPVNTQSWSFRLTAGSDLGGAARGAVLPLDQLAAGKGSILVGENYAAVPNTSTAVNGAIGTLGLTRTSLRIFRMNGAAVQDLGTRYEVIRTGTGDIGLSAGRDVQLRNQFATIYTAGVRIPNPRTIYSNNDFRPPTFFFQSTGADSATNDNGGLGAAQQFYGPLFTDEFGQPRRMPQWSLSGGNLAISAGADIARYAGLDLAGQPIADSSRQQPTNWLYRRGQVDPTTGLFGSVTYGTSVDPSASTAWWIDYSNFFQGVGALGGGDVFLSAGDDITNVDAVAPTNARMAGRVQNPDLTFTNIAPNADLLHELGGGDVTLRAGNDIDGGIYYVERGKGVLAAGGEIRTNRTRSPSFGRLRSPEEIQDERTWLPTTLFLGKGQFDVSARGSVLLGPTLNAFLMPQGLNNKTWYRTFFNTFAPDSTVTVSSLGGSITHRLAATLEGESAAGPIFLAWLDRQNRFNSSTLGAATPQGTSSAYFQTWLRLAERDLGAFATATTISAPNLRSTAFTGDLNVVGTLNLFPSPTGGLELVAGGQIAGLQPSGVTENLGTTAVAWTAARVNVSDTNPAFINSITSPSGSVIGSNFLREFFAETGSFSGANAAADVQQALHALGVLHTTDAEPVRLYAGTGDISGLTLFSPKKSLVFAERDITDIAFYIQHTSEQDISIVSAGRDVLPYNENSPRRSIAQDPQQGNFIIDTPETTVLVNNGLAVTTFALPGDIQIGGGGTLEVLAGRNLDLGTGANLNDGRGVGITSIGNARNPFLPFAGADLVVFAGVGGIGGGPALGLAGSTLDFESLLEESTGLTGAGTAAEQQALDAMARFFGLLRVAGTEAAETGSYATGFAAANALFGTLSSPGEIFTRARDIRTASGGSVTMAAPGGGLTMASDIFGNPLTPPGIVTEYGGEVSIFTQGDVDIGQARIFTLRGGDVTIWSSAGDIAAGTSPKTVVTAPPTRVLIDSTSADVQTDLGGLATGGGIGVLASVEGVEEGDVFLIAPGGTVDAGDAGIRATGDITIAAVSVLNADNISAGGASVGVPTTAVVAAPNIAGLSSASSSTGAANSAATQVANQARPQPTPEETPSVIAVEVLGYGGGEDS